MEKAIHYTEIGNLTKAKEAFNEAIKQNPRNAKAYFGLGGIYNMEKDHAKAIKLFQKAVALDPTYVDAHYGLAFTYEIIGEKEKAAKEYARHKELKTKLDHFMQKESR